MMWFIVGLLMFLHTCISQGHQSITEPQSCTAIPDSVVVNPDANFMLGALLSVRAPNKSNELYECGPIVKYHLQAYEALRWTIGLLNQNNGKVLGVPVNDSFIPGVSFGLKIMDSCGHPAMASLQLLQLFPEIRHASHGPALAPPKECSTATLPNQLDHNVIGVIDMTDATQTPDIKKRLDELHIPSLPIDAETSIPAQEKAKAMILLAIQMGWKWAALVYTNDSYSIQGARALGRLAASKNLCLGMVQEIPYSINTLSPNFRVSMARLMSALHNTSGIFVFARGAAVASLLELLPSGTNTMQWFFSMALPPDWDVPSQVLFLSPLMVDVSAFDKYWFSLSESVLATHQRPEVQWFLEYLRSIPSTNNATKCFGGRNVQCVMPLPPEGLLGKSLRNTFAMPVIQAAFALAQSIRHAWQSHCKGVPGSCPELRSMTREQFSNHFLNIPQLGIDHVPIGYWGKHLNTRGDKNSPSLSLALMIRVHQNSTQIMTYIENKVEVVDHSFSGQRSPCPNRQCQLCIGVQESRLEDDDDPSSDFWILPPIRQKPRTFLLMTPHHGSATDSKTINACHPQTSLPTAQMLAIFQKKFQETVTVVPKEISFEPVIIDTCVASFHITSLLNQLSEDNSDNVTSRLPLAVVLATASRQDHVIPALLSQNYTIISAGDELTDSFLPLGSGPRLPLFQMAPSPRMVAETAAELLQHFQRHSVALVHLVHSVAGMVRMATLRDLLQASNMSCSVLDRTVAAEAPEERIRSVASEVADVHRRSGLRTLILEADPRIIQVFLGMLKSFDVKRLTLISLTEWPNPGNFSTVASTVFILRPRWPTVSMVEVTNGLNLSSDQQQQLGSMKIAAAFVATVLKTLPVDACREPASCPNPVPSGMMVSLQQSIRSTTINYERNSSLNFRFAADHSGLMPMDVFQLSAEIPREEQIGTYFSGVFTLRPDSNLAGLVQDRFPSLSCQTRNALLKDSQDHLAIISWDNDQPSITLGAAFAVHEPRSYDTAEQCGPLRHTGSIDAIEAFLWAIDQVNGQADVLPGVRLGSVIFDTCGDSLRAARLLSQMLVEGYPISIGQLGAFVAGSSGQDLVTVQELVSSRNVTTVALRTPIRFQDGAFPGQFGISWSSPNLVKAQALLALLKFFNWTYVTVLYSSDRMHMADVALALNEMGTVDGVKVALLEAVPEDEETRGKRLPEIIGQLTRKRKDGARVVVSLLDDRQLHSIFEWLGMLEDKNSITDLVWITTGHERLFLENRGVVTTVLSLSFLTTRIPKFENHISNLHLKNNSRNPWFKEFWQQTFHCNGPSCYDGRFTLHNHHLAKSADAILTIDTVFHLAQALEGVRRSLCPGKISGLCEEMLQKPWQQQMLEVTNKIRQKKDQEHSGIFSLAPENTLDVYHLQEVDSGTFAFVKIGRFSKDMGLMFSTNDDSMQSEGSNFNHGLPQVLTSVQSVCLPCQNVAMNGELEPTTQYEYFPDSSSSVLLLLDVHSKGKTTFQCGPLNSLLSLQTAWTFGATLEDLHNSSSGVHPEVARPALGGVLVDHCGDPDRARQQIYNLFTQKQKALLAKDSIVAAIALDDWVGQAAADTLKGTGIPTISISLPSSAWTLETRSPSLLLRPSITPADRLMAIVSLLGHFQWTRVSLLSSGGPWQDLQRSNFTFLAATYSICVSNEFVVDVDVEEVEAMRILQDLRRHAGSRVIVVLTEDAGLVRALLTAAEFTVSSDRLVFVLPDHTLVDDPGDFSSHILALALDYDDRPAGRNERWHRLAPTSKDLPQDWLSEIWLQQFGCRPSFNGNPSTGSTIPLTTCSGSELLPTSPEAWPSANHVYQAVHNIAEALQKVKSAYCSQQHTSQTTLSECAPEARNAFFHELENLWHSNTSHRLAILNSQQSGSSVDKQLEFVKIGKWERGHLTVTTPLVSFGEKPGTISRFACNGQCPNSCKEEPLLQRSTAEFDFLGPPLGSRFGTIWGLIASALSGLGVVMVLICMVYLSAFVPSSGLLGTGPLARLVLVSLMLLYGLNFAFVVRPGDVICGIRRFALGVVYALLFSAKLVRVVKSWQQLYSCKEPLLEPKSRPRSGLQLLTLSLLLTSVQVGLATAWLIFSPPRAAVSAGDQWPRCIALANYEEELVVSLAYVMLLMVLTIFFGGLSWGSQEEDHEPRWVLLSSVLTALVWVAWTVAITHAPQLYRDPSVIAINLLSATINLVILFARKVFVRNRVPRDLRSDAASSCGSMYSSAYKRTALMTAANAMSGITSNVYVTQMDNMIHPRRPRSKPRGQVQVADLYPMDVYDMRSNQYSSLEGRPRMIATMMKSEDYF